MNTMVYKSVLIVVSLVALVLGFWIAVNQHHGEGPLISEEVGFVYPQAREIGDFNLLDYDNKSINQQRFEGKWWLVYFGFTFCPDACPTALADMKKIKAQFDTQTSEEVDFVFISVDPDRDTPGRLKDYVSYFDPKFLGATGDKTDLQDLATRVGVVFIVPENPEDENYVVDHSTFMLLWNPDAQLKAIFKAPHKPEDVVDGIKKILAAS